MKVEYLKYLYLFEMSINNSFGPISKECLNALYEAGYITAAKYYGVGLTDKGRDAKMMFDLLK
jgi:Mn-dependent DtxR family transcriptional regulator